MLAPYRQVLVKLVKPYTRMYLAEIANGLNNIPIEEVEELLCALVLDGKLNARIDQVRLLTHVPSHRLS